MNRDLREKVLNMIGYGIGPAVETNLRAGADGVKLGETLRHALSLDIFVKKMREIFGVELTWIELEALTFSAFIDVLETRIKEREAEGAKKKAECPGSHVCLTGDEVLEAIRFWLRNHRNIEIDKQTLTLTTSFNCTYGSVVTASAVCEK